MWFLFLLTSVLGAPVTAAAFLNLSRSDITPVLSRGVASHVRLPGPLLPLVLRRLGTNQQRPFGRGVSPSWFLHHGDGRLRWAGSSLPVPAAAAAAVQPPAAEPPPAAAAAPADPAVPATAAPAVSTTTGD